MEDLEADRLQVRLERLESGEPLERCLAELSEEEQALLRLAFRLRQVEWPVRDQKRVAGQRAALVNQVEREASKMEKISSRTRERLRIWLVPAAFAAVAGLIVLLVIFWGGGMGRVPGEKGTPAPVVEATPAYQVWLPLIAAAQPPSPDRARLLDVRGWVEVFREGSWQRVIVNGSVVSGEKIRTGTLSGATLGLYDGGRIELGAEAELDLKILEARTGGEPRVVQLVQVRGQSRHEVAHATAAGSEYRVDAAGASGTAKGTVFGVDVEADGASRFWVDEGKVEVSGAGRSVMVEAGKLSVVAPEAIPSDPVFRVSGEGTVEAVGASWTIAGQVFQVYTGTEIVGDPIVGDWVSVEGYLRADNTRVAERIVLLRRSQANRFSLTGILEARSGTLWTVAGQSISVTAQTELIGAAQVNDTVRVEGLILPGGTLQAERVELITETLGLPFDFTGVVESMAADQWIISGVTVQIVTDTAVTEGLAVGDVVRARGLIQSNGAWVAASIVPALPEEQSFEITGQILTMEPWNVGGFSFETREWTDIAVGLESGDRVRVRGWITEDGTRVAFSIEKLDEEERTIILIGTVESREPWVVSGISLVVDGKTEIADGIVVGMLVRVEARLLLDGSWQAISIRPLATQGCLTLNAVVVSVSGDQLRVVDWPALPLDEDTEIEGDLRPNSVVQLRVCFVGNRMYLVSILIIEAAQPPIVTPPANGGEGGGSVTICHKPGKNQQTMTVPQSALKGHLGHGDTLGGCP